MPPKFKPKKPKPRKPYTLERKVGIKRVAEEEATRPKGTKIGKGADVQSIENVLALEASAINPATIPETTTLPEWTGNMGSSMEEAWGAYETDFKSKKKVEPVPSYEPPPTKLEKPDWTGRSGMPQEYPVGPEKYPQKKFELRPEKAKKQDADAYVKDATPFEQQPLERTRAMRRDYLSRAKMTDEGAKIQPLRGNKKVDTDWMMASEQRNMTNQEIVHFSDQGISQREYLAQREVRPMRLHEQGEIKGAFYPDSHIHQHRDPESGRYTSVPNWAKGIGFNPDHTESYRDEIRRKSTAERTILDRGPDYAPLPDMDLSLMPIEHDKLNAVGRQDRRRLKSDAQVRAEEEEYARNYQEPIKPDVPKPKRTQTHSGIPLEGKGYEYEGMPPTFDEEPMDSVSSRFQSMNFEPEPEPLSEDFVSAVGGLSLEPAGFDAEEITDAMDAMAITSAPEGVPFAEVIAEDERLKRLAKQEQIKGESVGAGGAKKGREVKKLIRQMKTATEVEKVELQRRINELQGVGWGKGDFTGKMERELAGKQDPTFLPQKHTIKFRGITQGGTDITDEMGQIVSQTPMPEGMIETHQYRQQSVYNQGGGMTGESADPIDGEPSAWIPSGFTQGEATAEQLASAGRGNANLYGNYDEWNISDDEAEGEPLVEDEPSDGPVIDRSIEVPNWGQGYTRQPVKRAEKTMMDFLPKEGFEGPTPLHEDPTRELTQGEIRAGERWQSYAEKQGFEFRAGASKPWRELPGGPDFKEQEADE